MTKNEYSEKIKKLSIEKNLALSSISKLKLENEKLKQLQDKLYKKIDEIKHRKYIYELNGEDTFTLDIVLKHLSEVLN